MTKKKSAVLWKSKGQFGITLNLPCVMLFTESGKSESEFEKVEDVPLPRAMTSNQFNNWCKTDEAKEWLKPTFEKHMIIKKEGE